MSDAGNLQFNDNTNKTPNLPILFEFINPIKTK